MDRWENVNLAGTPSHAETEAALRKQLRDFFQHDARRRPALAQ